MQMQRMSASSGMAAHYVTTVEDAMSLVARAHGG
jgi:hypothetical protein